jgi:hypothetical protein
MSAPRRMRLLVIGDFRWHNGSSHVIREYVRHATLADMEIAVSRELGKRDGVITRHLPYCDNLNWATHVLVVFEGFPLLSGSDIERLDRAVPRSRRAVIDADGHWSSRVAVDADDNTWPCGSDAWRDHISAVADVVLQPALGHPATGAIAFPYFGLPPRGRRRAGFGRRRLDVQYVGSNWFRAAQLVDIMSVARQALGESGRLRVCGTYWDGTTMRGFESATAVDTESLRRLEVQVRPPVPFGMVVLRMGEALLTPVLVRPVLGALRFLTPRMLETLAAETLPVYREEDRYVGELYSDDRGEFCLDGSEDSFARVMRDRRRLSNSAHEIYAGLSDRFSYPVLVRKLRDVLSASG